MCWPSIHNETKDGAAARGTGAHGATARRKTHFLYDDQLAWVSVSDQQNICGFFNFLDCCLFLRALRAGWRLSFLRISDHLLWMELCSAIWQITFAHALLPVSIFPRQQWYVSDFQLWPLIHEMNINATLKPQKQKKLRKVFSTDWQCQLGGIIMLCVMIFLKVAKKKTWSG